MPAARDSLQAAPDPERVNQSPREYADSDEPISSSEADSAVAEEEDDMDSQSSDFLEREMPRFQYQPPACFCNGGAFCQKHQGQEIAATGLIKLLRKQFA